MPERERKGASGLGLGLGLARSDWMTEWGGPSRSIGSGLRFKHKRAYGCRGGRRRGDGADGTKCESSMDIGLGIGIGIGIGITGRIGRSERDNDE